MVRYYGYYSNLSRGKRKKAEIDEVLPSILKPDGSSKTFRKNWARLIQKIYEADPLTCPKCSSEMSVIAVIDDKTVIKKILKHLDLWDVKNRPPPKIKKATQVNEAIIDYFDSQLPPSDDFFFPDPEYSVDDYIS